MGIVANARSGLGRGRGLVERLQSELKAHDFESRISWTLEERGRLTLAATALNGCRCLVAVGGDGTVSALVNENPKVPLMVLPAGTENLFARHFGMTDEPEQAAQTIAEGKTADLDLGSTNNRLFTLMAGIGFDADVVTRHHLARVGSTGVAGLTHRLAYVIPVLLSSLHYRFPLLSIEIANQGGREVLHGSTAFVFNLPRYALGLPVAPDAIGNDGWLDLVVFEHAGPLRMLHYLWLIFRGKHLDRKDVWHRRVKAATIRCPRTVPIQLDGDPGGKLNAGGKTNEECVIKVVPNAIRVLLPK